MIEMRLKHSLALGILLIALIALGFWQQQWDLTAIEQAIERHSILGPALYVAFLAICVVLLPLSSLPLLPIATRLWGVPATAALSILGWWIGCLIAFQVARYGRHWLEKITSLSAIDRIEKQIPADIGFFGIIIIRMILPVDITSYALGLFKHLKFSTYALASLIGIIPFAFVWSYAGGEIGKGEIVTGLYVLIGMLAVAFFIKMVWEQHR